MEVNGLAGRWRSLAERFRRIANNDCSEREVLAAAADGGRLVYVTKAAGLLPDIDIELSDLPPKSKPSDDDSRLLANIWYGLVQFLPGNPCHAQWEHRNWSVGTTDPSDWRIRAENFAAVCDVLANTVELTPPRLLRVEGLHVRPAYRRDQLFLEWYDDEKSATCRKPATIRDTWNAMSKQQRADIAPDCFSIVTVDTVKTAIKKVRKEKT